MALELSPQRRLHFVAVDSEGLTSASATRIREAFDRGVGRGILDLALAELTTKLPPDLAYFRELASHFLTSVCANSDPETTRAEIRVPPSRKKLEELAARVPPMPGAEYVDVALLDGLWAELEEAFRAQLRDWKGTVQSYLHAHGPAWNLVGRVCLHLAENNKNEEYPFAFLATYTTRLAANSKAQHLPLGRAVDKSGSARDKAALLSLLLPIERAAKRSAFLRELLESGDLFHPLAWTPREAHRFLKEVPAFESSGVIVRVPDWWKSRPARPQVSVRVGGKAPSKLGLDAVLDFSVDLTLDGEPLTEEEWQTIRSSTDGLALVRGRWVEVDREKLEQVLAHWRTVQRRAGRDGLTFLDGMRLLAGVDVEDGAGSLGEATPEWSTVVAGDWLRETLQSLRDPDSLASAARYGLKATLRPYQQVGVNWLRLLSSVGLGACLADDMGLGKTIQVLGLLLHLKGRPHLLVVPASLIGNWMAEIERFAPDLSVAIAHSSAGASTDSASDLVITTYGTVGRLQWLRDNEWDTVILDEAQAIKNPAAKQTRACKALKGRVKIALTGTPVENRLGDLWSIFDFLNPGLLGSAKAFTGLTKRLAAHGNYAPLRNLVRPYILRRLKTDKRVISDLPDKTELIAYCSLTKIQAALYQDSVDALREQLTTVRSDSMRRRGMILASLMRLKQICNHPSQWLRDGSWAPESSGKLARLAEICESIAARQEKVLVFSQFREVTEPLASFLKGVFGREGLVLAGDTPINRRQELVDRFQSDDKLPFFVLSVKAGGTGLNLTAASHVIHFDRWWNPAVENQATDRAFRIGQKKNVLVHKLVCRGTIEEHIDELIEAKKGLSREILDGGGEKLVTEMADEEILRLVALDIHRALEEG